MDLGLVNYLEGDDMPPEFESTELLRGRPVVCLRPDAIPETWAKDHVESRTYMQDGTALGRLPTLDEVANAAVFAASDWASAMTGTVVNLTCGSIME